MTDLLKKESRTTLTSTGTNQSDDDKDRDETVHAGDNFQTLGWKVVLLLQFQPQFVAVILIGIYISFICSIMDVAFAYAAPNDEVPNTYSPMGIDVIYSFDLVYAVDILLTVMYKNTKWNEMQHLYDERHALMVVLDIISIIPLDPMYYSLTEANMKVVSIIRLRYTLRIIRFVATIKGMKRAVGINHVLMELLDFLISFSLLLVSVSCIWYLLVCRRSKCQYKDFKIAESLYIMSGTILSRGYPYAISKDISMFFLQMLVNFASFIYITGFVVGLFLIAALHQYKIKTIYGNMQEVIITKLGKTKVQDDLLYKTSQVFFNLFWKCRKGVRFDNVHVEIVPEVIAKEINLDISWDALKHSHLFRDQEVHFLRFAAPYMEQKFMIPGETIYKRNHFKSSMVYVATGVIQVLSEQDGESPIISFSGGTCIGESTLLLDYPSTCSVVCKSYCELYVLYRKDFMKLVLKYPEECKNMLKNIKNRYKEAKEYQKLLDFTYDEIKQRRELIVIKWMKATLHELMLKDKAASDNEKIILSIEERQTINEFDKLIFCCNYLDMLVIAEQIELVTDTVFLRTSCPCILQPDSFIVQTWNNVIVLAIFILGFTYPYYASFQPKTSTAYLILSYAISILWVLDIYISLSTGIRAREGIVAEVTQIALYKFQTVEFYMDLFAAIPIELVALFAAGNPGSQAFVLLQSPRLLKIYRIGQFFDEDLTIFGIITRTYLKYMVYMILLTYYIAALLYLYLCYEFVCDTDNVILNLIQQFSKGDIKKVLQLCIFLAIQQITTLGLEIHAKGVLDSLFIPLIFIELVGTLFYINMVANLSAIFTLKRYDTLKLREYIESVTMVMQKANVSPRLCKNVILNIRGQIAYNQGSDIIYPPSKVVLHYHPFLVREIRRLAFLQGFQRVPLFAGWPNELLGNLTAVAFINIIAPGQVLTHAGEICKEMHVILDGFCELYGSADEKPKTIGPGCSISVIELCCEIPVVNNVISLTHCKLCTLGHEQFMQHLQFYPELLMEVKNAAAATVESINVEEFTGLQASDIQETAARSKSDEHISFKHFGYRLDLETKKGVDFHQYFDKLGLFSYLRYVFMRHTITPYGRFIYYWEIFRCIFAFITSVLTPVAFLATCPTCHWNYILTFLDFTAWLDIFVRHHVCYFDEKGIEITHPAKTVVHYWKHCFIIDLLGTLPFEILLAPLFKPKITVRQTVFLQMTRILQTHRIFGAISYFNKDFLSPSNLWSLTKFVPAVVLVINLGGSALANVRCQFDSKIAATENFTAGVYCPPTAFVSRAEVEKPLNPIQTHMYAMYTFTVGMTGPGLGGYSISTADEADTVTFTTFIGFWIFLYVTVRIISHNLFRNVDFTSYQEAMHSLVKFLSYRRIDVKLKHEVIEHFEHVWRKKQGKDLHEIIKCFNYAIQEDILLDVYGKTMKESDVFSQATDSFFRSLLLNVKHEFFMKRGIIEQVNNVHNKIYFLFKGQVEVLGPDYNRLLILPVGSLFGNIDDCPMSRQTLTMVAKGHVELLSIDTTAFYQILSNYRNLNIGFRNLTSINTDYLLGAPPSALNEDSIIFNSGVTLVSVKSISKAHTFINNVKQWYAVTVWEYIVLILVCYIDFVLELYHVTVQEHSITLIIFLYILDILFVLNIILKFHTPYENEFGVLITNRRQIARRYLRNRLGFPLEIASVIPLEAFPFLFNSKMKWTLWHYCRCNRFIRICFVADYFQRRNQKLNININVMRTLSLLLWFCLSLQIISSLLLTVTCINPKYNIKPVLSCDWRKMAAIQKFETYSYQFSIVLNIFTMTSIREYFPNSPLLTAIILVLLIGSRFLIIYLVSEIASMLNIVLKKRTSYEENVDKIKEHIVRERISPALLERVLTYMRVLWRKKGGLQFPPLLLDAPYYLREGVLNSMFGCHLRRHEVFRRCHVDLIRQIAAYLQTRTFFPGDYITFINDSDGCMYFIHEGAVDVLSEEDLYEEKIDTTLYGGDSFGLEQGLYPDIGHAYSYRANRHTVILVLNRQNWIHLLDFFPASKRIIFQNTNEKK